VKYVVNLNEVGKNDILLVGGKGANLGEMFQAKFPVPEGFCITSESYDTFIDENNFGSIIEDFLKKIYLKKDESQKLSQKLIDILSKGRLPEKIETGIKIAYKNLGQNKRVAVRSSATAEDLPEASFAGQQETYLNIMGEECLVHTIKRCFASLWTDRAIAYRKRTGFDKKKFL
jgi:Phosphoenolpyruvate synthase/pyruvate phosphate dikinase